MNINVLIFSVFITLSLFPFSVNSQSLKYVNENNVKCFDSCKKYYYGIYNTLSFVVEGNYCNEIDVLPFQNDVEIVRNVKHPCLIYFKINASNTFEKFQKLCLRNKNSLDTLGILYLNFTDEIYYPKISINTHPNLEGGCFYVNSDSLYCYYDINNELNSNMNCEILEYDIQGISLGKEVFRKENVLGDKLPLDIKKQLTSIASPNGGLKIYNVKIKVDGVIIYIKDETFISSCFY